MNKEGVNGFPPESSDLGLGDPVLPSTDFESQLSILLFTGHVFDTLDVDGQPFPALEESGPGEVCQQGSPCLLGYGGELGLADASQNFPDGNFEILPNHNYQYQQGVHNSGSPGFTYSGYENSLAQGNATAGYTRSAWEPCPNSVSPAQLMGGYSPSTTSLTWHHQQSPISTTLASPPTPLSLSSPVFHYSTPVENAFLTPEFTPSMSSLVFDMPNTPLVATTDAEVFTPALGASESAVAASNHYLPAIVPEIHFDPAPDAQATPDQPGQEPDKKPCHLCHKMINNKARDLKRHMDTHKKKREPLACMICGTLCCRRDNLKRHMRDKHEDDLPALPRGPPKGSKRAPRRQAGNEGG